MVNPFDNFSELGSWTKGSIADHLALQGYTLVCSLCDSQRVIAQSLGSRVPASEAPAVRGSKALRICTGMKGTHRAPRSFSPEHHCL